ncbi:MAG: DNA topology modulation protein FlaR [Pseudomonadota bacterium]
MQRVMIVGGSGSGKSTLARALGDATGLPVHHMDHIHWMPGWEQRPREQRREMATEIEMGASWIFEGGFSATYAHRLSRADTAIWLDLPVGLRLWRVTKRLLRYWGQERPDMAPGCREGIHGETWAFYVWIWSTRISSRTKLAGLFATAPAHVQVHHLTSRRMVRRFLEGVTC